VTDMNVLRQLAQIHGIDLNYHDIWGTHHDASEATLRALLVAMGVLAPDESGVAAAVAAHEQAQWTRITRPVHVLRQCEAPLRIRVVLPDGAQSEGLGWRLVQESGEVSAGPVDWQACSWLGARAMGDGNFSLREWTLPELPPVGYHRLELHRNGDVIASTALIVAPDRCFEPEQIRAGNRLWGPAVQLYALRSNRNWGMGDFTDLRALLELWAEQGADIVGVNPLHALFAGNPGHASPYGPSSRLFLNVLYLDLEALPDWHECPQTRARAQRPEFQARLQALRDTALVDYEGVAAVKRGFLDDLFHHFWHQHVERKTERAADFAAFCAAGGEALHRHAVFEAQYEECHARDQAAWCWQQWPEPLRDAAGPDVAAFAARHRERVAFFQYLQWQAHLQLEAVTRRAEELGMAVGLYLDFSVSVDNGGSDTWCNPSLFASGVSVGAPPDDFSREGQNWGLPPFNPQRLVDSAYAPFIATLRRNMHLAGALRIDHVMGLLRLFWIPRDQGAAAGSYVRYPFEDLLAIVALESQRNRCLIIGEDLGTVPPEVRTAMQRLGMLCYRPLIFEKYSNGEFRRPQDIERNAVVTVTTHDLPTLAGFWENRDLHLRRELGLYDRPEAFADQSAGRNWDRTQLLRALEREGLLPRDVTVEPASAPQMTQALACAIQTFLARSPASVMTVQLEDVLGVVDQVNLPGNTSHVYANWSRKLPLPLEQWPDHHGFRRTAAALAETRGGNRSRGRREDG
jgi:(1->4)-alpha-D-glucan 1-alpha-D-glucosylmutase